MKKLEIYLLESTLEHIVDTWDVSDDVHMNYSNVMKSLYLNDFPEAWGQEENRSSMATIGANDYFNKWGGEEFMSLEGSQLDDLYDLVDAHIADASIIDGVRTGMPISAGNYQLMFYNKKFVPTAPKTFAELMRVAEELQKKENMEFPISMPTSACYFILPMLCGYGADLWRTPGETAIAKEPLKKTIVLLREMIYEKKLAPIKWEQEDSTPYFAAGKAGFCVGGDWHIHELQEALGEDLGICAIPPVEGECLSTSNANYLFLSKYLDEALYEKARNFCNLILSDEKQGELLESMYRMPVTKSFTLDTDAASEVVKVIYDVYKKSFILPPKIEVSHMYHVLADLLERDVLTSAPEDELAADYCERLLHVEDYTTSLPGGKA